MKLARRLAGISDMVHKLAPLYFLHMWTEWASNPEEWRPLNRQVTELQAHPWRTEDLSFIIENACGWRVDGVPLLVPAIEAGIYALQNRGDITGLTLPGWAELNGHLMPGFESMQSKGGKASRVTVHRQLADKMASQQHQIFQGGQGVLMLNGQTKDPAEQKAALALIIQVDRHCGLQVRVSGKYTEEAIRDAVSIVKRHPQPVIDKVLGYLYANRATPEVIKVPDTVLAEFDRYLEAANKDEA